MARNATNNEDSLITTLTDLNRNVLELIGKVRQAALDLARGNDSALAYLTKIVFSLGTFGFQAKKLAPDHRVSNLALDNNLMMSGKYDYIYTQGSNTTMQQMNYGMDTMDINGCGLIAVYNALLDFGQHKKLADIVYDFESSGGTWFGMEGTWGTSPTASASYLQKQGLTVERYSEVGLDKVREDDDVFVITFKNKGSPGFHTIMVKQINGKLYAYNNGSPDFVNGSYQPNKHNSFADLFEKSGLYVSGYKLTKPVDATSKPNSSLTSFLLSIYDIHKNLIYSDSVVDLLLNRHKEHGSIQAWLDQIGTYNAHAVNLNNPGSGSGKPKAAVPQTKSSVPYPVAPWFNPPRSPSGKFLSTLGILKQTPDISTSVSSVGEPLSKPEVIAPLDNLRSMMTSDFMQGMNAFMAMHTQPPQPALAFAGMPHMTNKVNNFNQSFTCTESTLQATTDRAMQDSVKSVEAELARAIRN